MRITRLGAVVIWLAMASFAIAGFAAFSPEASEPTIAPATAPTTTEPQATSVGLAAGRIAALSFAGANPTSNGAASPTSERAAIAALAAAATDSTSTTSAAPTTTEAPTTTQAPTTTEAPTTTQAPSTTEAPPTTAETTTTTEAPPPTEPSLDVPAGTEPWVGLVQANFAAADVEKALLVMWCESRGDASATNPSSGAAGLFQHLPKFWTERSTAAGLAGADIYDPSANVAVAAWLVYEGGGWSHWYPSAGCWG